MTNLAMHMQNFKPIDYIWISEIKEGDVDKAPLRSWEGRVQKYPLRERVNCFSFINQTCVFLEDREWTLKGTL